MHVVRSVNVKTVKTFFYKIYSIPLVFFLIACAILISSEIKITGKVKLSDNPQTGHGGVNITAERVSAVSANDGSFDLKFTILSSKYTNIKFQKIGYKDTIIGINISWGQDTTINIGEIRLSRLVTNFFDNFNDGNAVGWIEDNLATYRVENGEYSIESPDDGYQHWAKHPFYSSGDFILEAKVKYVSGRINEPYGIGIFDTTYTITCFFVSKDGWYKLCYFRNNSWNTIKDWTFSSVITTIIGQWNKLKIEKNGTLLNLFINDVFLDSFSSGSIDVVNYAGLYVQGNLHIHFDDVLGENR